MAQVPYDPNLTVRPNDDPLSVLAARPEAFGALTAEARMHAGAALTQAGQSIGAGLDDLNREFKRQKALTDDLYANDVMNSAMKETEGLWMKYRENEGQNAWHAREGFQQGLDDIYKRHLEAAPDPQTKAQLAGSLRTLTESYYKFSDNYALEQRKVWQTKSVTEGAQRLGTAALIAVQNPKERDMYLDASDAQVRQGGQNDGFDTDTIDNLVRENRGFNVATMVKSLLVNGKGDQAQEIYNTYKDKMGATSRVESEAMLNPFRANRDGEAKAKSAIGISLTGESSVDGTPGNVPKTYRPYIEQSASKYGLDPGILAAQLRQESGFNSKVVSPAGATGIAQFMPGTAARFGINPRDPVQSIDGQGRYMKFLLDRYHGDYKLALAGYNWGEGNVDKWIARGSNPDQMPAETRHYVAAILGGKDSGLAASEKAQFNSDLGGPVDRGTATRRLLDATEGDPSARAAGLSYLGDFYTGQAANHADVASRAQDTIAATEAGVPGLSLSPEVSSLPDGKGQRLIDEFEIAKEAGQAVQALQWESPAEVNKTVSEMTSGIENESAKMRRSSGVGSEEEIASGDRYRFRVAAAARVGAALTQRQQALAADPAGYVQANPTVAAAMKAVDPAKPETYMNYVQKSLAVQDYLGVPVDRQHVLPKDVASRTAASIMNSADPVGTIKQLKDSSGDAWSQVFRDLVSQGKLAPAYQAVAQLDDPADAQLLARALNDTKGDNFRTWQDRLGKSASTMREKAVTDTGLQGYIHSLRQSGSPSEQVDGLTEAAVTLAYAKKLYNQIDDDTAVQQAVDSFTKNFEYLDNGNARVPTDKFDRVTANIQPTLKALKPENLTNPYGVFGQPGWPGMDEYVKRLQEDDHWVTSPKADAIWLKDNAGKTVLDKKGNPISIPFNGRLLEPPARIDDPIKPEDNIFGDTPNPFGATTVPFMGASPIPKPKPTPQPGFEDFNKWKTDLTPNIKSMIEDSIKRGRITDTDKFYREIFDHLKRMPNHVSELMKGAGASPGQIALARQKNGQWYLPDSNRDGKYVRLNIG